MKKYIQIKFNPDSTAEEEILIAILSENGFYAFEQNEDILDAYILETDFNEVSLNMILPPGIKYITKEIVEENWNKEWEKQVEPVLIGNFVGIRPAFCEPLRNVDHEIIITPKMSFGTGHHPTTHLVIELMAQITFKNKTVLDFGTGTGILAILAEKLGAAKIIGIDYDERSISNAFENIAANNCEKILLEQKDNIIGISGVDVVTANINFNILSGNVENLAKLLNPGSFLIISGFLSGDEYQILSLFSRNGFKKNTSAQRDGWMAILLEKEAINFEN